MTIEHVIALILVGAVWGIVAGVLALPLWIVIAIAAIIGPLIAYAAGKGPEAG